MGAAVYFLNNKHAGSVKLTFTCVYCLVTHLLDQKEDTTKVPFAL